MSIAVSIGDPNGVGIEIAIKAWAFERENIPEFTIFGNIAPLLKMAKHLNIDINIENIDDLSKAINFKSALPVYNCGSYGDNIIGTPNPENAELIINSIKEAVNSCLNGTSKALVTLPIAKSVLYKSGFKYPGHTEYIAALCENTDFKRIFGPVMMLSIEGLRVALITIHEPISKIPSLISQEKIIRTVKIAHESMKYDFGIKNPKIAILGLNPHAGEDGTIGHEEIETINPACKILRDMGIDCSDALPADSAFNPILREKYDIYIAMYHDQGLIPIKALDFWGGVNTSLGLPIIRTSPDHGTGFDIAGKNIACIDSFINALKTAEYMAKNRIND